MSSDFTKILENLYTAVFERQPKTTNRKIILTTSTQEEATPSEDTEATFELSTTNPTYSPGAVEYKYGEANYAPWP